MLPTYFSPCPQQTQILGVYQGYSNYLILKARPAFSTVHTAEKQRWITRCNSTERSPTWISLASDNRLYLYNPFWPTFPPEYLYYYADDPRDQVGGTDLHSFWCSVPAFQFLYAPPLRTCHVYNPGYYVNLWHDRDVVSGPNLTTEWLVTVNGIPRPPFAVWPAAKQILLTHVLYGGNCTRVQYTPGPVKYLASDAGELPALDLTIPFPW